MTKEQSQELKGVAIIMMLLYHLFYVVSGGPYISHFTMNGVPFLNRFSEICYPVSLYVMISGYGLYATKISRNSSKSDLSRILNIYEHVWIILLLFLPLASILYPDRYPGSIWEIIKNALCLSSSYNTEYWFVLPYIVLLLLSNVICRCVEKWNTIVSLVVAFATYLTYLILYKLVGVGAIKSMIGPGICIYFVLGFILPFILGAMSKKINMVEITGGFVNRCGSKNAVFQQVIIFAILLSLIIVRMFMPNQSLQPFCVFILFLLFPKLRLGRTINSILKFLGKHSLNIWLIHTWLCYYLFKDFIYGLKYPVVIFIMTLGISILVSIIVELIFRSISKLPKRVLSYGQ